jgi:hypothetical protein
MEAQTTGHAGTWQDVFMPTRYMLSDYADQALAQARYEKLEDGSTAAGFVRAGVWSLLPNLAAAGRKNWGPRWKAGFR